MIKKRRTPHRTLLRKAVTYTKYQTQTDLAKYLGVQPSTVTMMLKRNIVHHKHWRRLEKLTGGAIKEADWRL
jgi:Mn-dependent DtxR family transcriptional regulator